MSRGRLLVASPELGGSPAGRRVAALLRALERRWEVRLAALPAGGGPQDRSLDALKALLAAEDYSAVLAIEHAASLALLPRLKLFTRVPIVLVAAGARAARASRPLERLRAAEGARLALASASDAWALPGSPNGRAGQARARLEPGWLAARLARLKRPPRAGRTELVSIVVPCFNGLRYTRECLEAVARHTRTPYEVIVVDNGSTDGTAAFARGRPRTRVLRNRENRGFGPAVNQGTRAARGRWVVWLNNDVVVTPGWLEGLLRCARRSPEVGAVGPCTNETVGLQKVAAAYPGVRGLARFAQAWALRHADRAVEAHRLVGFCMLVKREALERVGLLDERFSPGCYEDYDYCLRLRQAGFTLACALDVFVHHHGHKTFQGERAMLRQSERSREVFLDKWCLRALEFLDELDGVASSGPRAGRRR